jgi:hypothetical protein
MHVGPIMALSLSIMLQAPASPTFVAPTPEAELEGLLNGGVTAALKPTLAAIPPSDFNNGWGHQTTINVPDGGKWVWHGTHSHWETHYKQVNLNDGQWMRGNVSIENPDQLSISFTNARRTPGQIGISFDVEVRQQFRGNVSVREYHDGVLGLAIDSAMRADGKLTMTVQIYLFDSNTKLGWKVVSSNLSYSNVVADKMGQFGGESAKILGDAATGAINMWDKQKRDKDLASAGAAITSAIESKSPIDVVQELSKLIQKLMR